MIIFYELSFSFNIQVKKVWKSRRSIQYLYTCTLWEPPRQSSLLPFYLLNGRAVIRNTMFLTDIIKR
jgi:hypothetical protein